MKAAILFARADSIYKTMPGCDVWDIERDARNYDGPFPIVGHPPCRAWGQLRHFAKPRQDEKALATWCVDQIRKWGGVLEHPSGSTLWPVYGLPEPGKVDAWGGFTISAPQFWWGHPCDKNSRFYCVGVDPKTIELPIQFGEAPMVLESRLGTKGRPRLPKKDREKTPPALAEWLVELAARCKPTKESQ